MYETMIISKAVEASLSMSRQIWIWVEVDGLHFDVAIPKGKRFLFRVSGYEILPLE